MRLVIESLFGGFSLTCVEVCNTTVSVDSDEIAILETSSR
jgi:hypothetical protein